MKVELGGETNNMMEWYLLGWCGPLACHREAFGGVEWENG